MTVTNSEGMQVGTSTSKSLTLTGLSDGKYTFSGREYGQGVSSGRSFTTYSTEITFSFVVDTYVDNTKPTMPFYRKYMEALRMNR